MRLRIRVFSLVFVFVSSYRGSELLCSKHPADAGTGESDRSLDAGTRRYGSCQKSCVGPGSICGSSFPANITKIRCLKTFLPSTWQSARRLTILVMYDPGAGKKIETYAMARYAVGDMFKKAWDTEKEPDQWKALAQMIVEKNPKKIGVNRSPDFALGGRNFVIALRPIGRSRPRKHEIACHKRTGFGDRLARNADRKRDGGLSEHRPDGANRSSPKDFRKR